MSIPGQTSRLGRFPSPAQAPPQCLSRPPGPGPRYTLTNHHTKTHSHHSDTHTPKRYTKLYTKIHATQLKAQNTHTTQHGRIHKLTSICTTGHTSHAAVTNTRGIGHSHTVTQQPRTPTRAQDPGAPQGREACLTQKLRSVSHLRPGQELSPSSTGGHARAGTRSPWRRSRARLAQGGGGRRPRSGSVLQPQLHSPQAQSLSPTEGHHDQPPLCSCAVPLLRSPSHARMTQETGRGWSLSPQQLIQRTREAVSAETWETLFSQGILGSRPHSASHGHER